MADTATSASPSSTNLPQQAQPTPGGAPQTYDPSQNGGPQLATTPSHLPQAPPLQPMPIAAQNANPIPGAITGGPVGPGPNTSAGPVMGAHKANSSGGGYVRRAAPEPNKRALYVGGLDQRVTDDILRQIFETAGHVLSVKIIPDKNHRGLNYGFVEFDDPGAADRAMTNLNGRRVHQSEIRVNWAYQSSNSNKEDTSNHFHIFVGDLSNDVNDEVLLQAFSAFGTLSEARVMWDMKTGRSRGYGFVAFRERADAEKALSSMDGEWLGSRAIRCNWANQKGQPSISQQQAMAAMGMGMGMAPGPGGMPPFGGHHHFPTHGIQSYDMVVSQTPHWQTTCYVGNLTPYTTQNDLVPLFQNFGYVVETRLQSDRGFAFVKMDTHENAAMAICQLNGYNVNGRPLKCSWGKDRPPTMQYGNNYDAQQANAAAAAAAAAAGFNANPYFQQFGAAGGAMPGALAAGGSAPTPHANNLRGGWDASQANGPNPAAAAAAAAAASGFPGPANPAAVPGNIGAGPAGPGAPGGGRGHHAAHQSNAAAAAAAAQQAANVISPAGVMNPAAAAAAGGWPQAAAANPAAAFAGNFAGYQQG